MVLNHTFKYFELKYKMWELIDLLILMQTNAWIIKKT